MCPGGYETICLDFLTHRLKALYMFGNFQRPVFSFGVSHHRHKQACENLDSIGH